MEACGVPDGEQLLGVGALTPSATHFLRGCQLQVEATIGRRDPPLTPAPRGALCLIDSLYRQRDPSSVWVVALPRATRKGTALFRSGGRGAGVGRWVGSGRGTQRQPAERHEPV